MSWDDGLSKKQRDFCESYVLTFNATKAARAAGYSLPNKQGHRTLTNPAVRDAIRKLQAECASFVSHDRILQELCALAFFDPADCYDETGQLKNIHQIDPDTRKAIVGIETRVRYEQDGEAMIKVTNHKVRFVDRLRVLELLSRATGLFKNQIELSVNPLEDLFRKVAESPHSKPQGNIKWDR